MTFHRGIHAKAAPLLVLLLVLVFSACLDSGFQDPLGNVGPDPLNRQQWTVILSDSAGRVWIVQSDSAFAVHEDPPSAASAALWSVLDSAPDLRKLTLAATIRGREMQWTLSGPGGAIGAGTGALFSYVGNDGAPRFTGSATITLSGAERTVRFDALGGVPMPAEPVVIGPRSPTPPGRTIVSLRADDCPAAESQVLGFLATNRLRAEFAVPTRLVARNGLRRCSWALVDSLAQAGNDIAAHSRFHARAPAEFVGFYLETVGAARDLTTRGHPPHLWVQPGTWLSGAAHLDGPDKLRTPYAALLRRVYVGIEAYAVPGTFVSYVQGGTGGPPVYYLKDFDLPTLRALLDDVASRPQPQWIEFFWHTGDQPLDRLGAELAVIAEYRDRGAFDVLPLYDAVLAGATGINSGSGTGTPLGGE